MKQYTDESSEMIDDLLLGAADQMGDWKDYKAETTDWSWDSISGGK